MITDGSTDATVAKAANAPGITHLHQPLREGKVSAINRAVSAAGETEILIFSDANAMINPDAFLKMVGHFQFPHIGGLAGEKKVVADDLVPGKAEGIYWKYESWLKQLDSDFHTVVGAAGELFAIRRSLFAPIPQDVLLDDLYLSLMVCQQGKRMAYEPQAFATEGPSLSIADEWKRRVRIGAGAFQSLRLFHPLLNVFRYGKLSFQFFSHRVMRWLVCPFALLLIFIINILLVNQQINPLYVSTLVLQVLFYLFAWIGFSVAKRQKGSGIFLLPFYFVFMNLGMIAGLYRYLSGNQTVRWEKSRRAVLR
jgi:cellulose synthase/poly-beta-1,6-N-acetylglucosamine synthase-like glycosyltransferase